MFLTLIGYRGCGKTSAAVALAKRLALPTFDSDRIVQERAGCSIQEIFEQQGELSFRDLEERVIAEILLSPQGILAAGGGAILRETTRNRMRNAGHVIWLTASVEELGRRIASDPESPAQRPNLTEAGLLQEIESVLLSRLPAYEAASTLRIETGEKSTDEVADEIVRSLRLTGRD